MSCIKVKRSVYIKSPSDVEERSASVVYVDRDSPVLLEGVSSNGPSGKSQVFRRSEDNGKTWKTCKDTEDWSDIPIDKNLYWARIPALIFLDDNHNFLVRFIMKIKADKRMPIYAKDSPYSRYRYMEYQISNDSGLTWQKPIPLIIDGYDEQHWAPEVWHGKNSLSPSGNPPLILPDGRICVPFYLIRADRYEDLGPNGLGGLQSCCLLGTWSSNLQSIKWEAGKYTATVRAKSNGGTYEPTIIRLRDGRILMVMRANWGVQHFETGPCYKWYAISSDCGMSWSEAQVLKYDDGGPVYSPATYPQAFRSNKNGKVYLITNLMDYPYELWPSGSCWPRDILQIVEIDEKTLCLKRETLTVIDQRQPDQPRYIGFSNFSTYQDRQTSDLILFMTPMLPGYKGLYDHEKACRLPGNGVPGHCFRYDISFSE